MLVWLKSYHWDARSFGFCVLEPTFQDIALPWTTTSSIFDVPVPLRCPLLRRRHLTPAENLIDYDRRVSRNLISIVGETQFCEMEDFDVGGQKPRGSEA